MQKSINDFIEWTKIKVRLHLDERNKGLYFKEREIWWASLGINIGYETDGKHEKFERPVLIIKVFNGEVLWVLPLTSKRKTGKYYFELCGQGAKSAVILSQLRLISSKRLLRKIRRISWDEFNEIGKQLKSFI